MSTLPLSPVDLDPPWVALDLETTGLDSRKDKVIEIGAVKFVGDRVLDTFQTFVNPKRRLSAFIKQLTGITQSDVSGAPEFSGVAARLTEFVGPSPIVGHNVGFDLGFLEAGGVTLANPRCDTYDLAFVLLPGARAYNLGSLAKALGVPSEGAHRADADAAMVHGVFRKLEDMAWELDAGTISAMRRLAGASSWVLEYFLRSLETAKLRAATLPAASSTAGLSGVDTEGLTVRLRRERALRPDGPPEPVDTDYVEALLRRDSPVAMALPGFEEREEQIAMARAVADAINGADPDAGQAARLIVEAGTGVGKSLAYLLPAALYAMSNGKRVVVSTNTINLQEQLIRKDLPALAGALEDAGETGDGGLKFTQLKGRANYICLKRFEHLRSSGNVNVPDARVLSKAMVWLQNTETGDRSEINLGRRDSAAAWDRISAQGALSCPEMRGPCFLRAARERAAAAHIVVVNHALLLSDVTAGGTLIPKYDVLIVDEAHHLEDEATRRLGFEVGQTALSDRLQALAGDRGVFRETAAAVAASGAGEMRRATLETASSQVAALVPAARERIARLFAAVHDVLFSDADNRRQWGPQTEARITSGTRAQPGWSEVESRWHHVDAALSTVSDGVRGLLAELESLRDAGVPNYEGLLTELAGELQYVGEVRRLLQEAVPHPEDDVVYWCTLNRRDGGMVLHAAPLNVGDLLESEIYSRNETVIFTSATLSSGGSFKHVLERTGFEGAEELLVGSPFDYKTAAEVYVPEDMPEPNSEGYAEAVGLAVTQAVEAAGGRTMALFTSHAALQATASAVRQRLRSRGIDLYAQGIDGSPHGIMRRFIENPKSLLLGTASFWEGVDLAGESLQVLVLARLPFNVPTEPVFAARSELFERPFIEYALPQAVLRLRQGFGRLIRTRNDRGAVVILDSRVVARRYGRVFLDSLPDMTIDRCRLGEIGGKIGTWLVSKRQGSSRAASV